MAFWLRAGLVIGAIYYLSPLRLGEVAAPARTAQGAPTLAGIAGPLLDGMPESLRARMVETAAAEAGAPSGRACAQRSRRSAMRRPATP